MTDSISCSQNPFFNLFGPTHLPLNLTGQSGQPLPTPPKLHQHYVPYIQSYYAANKANNLHHGNLSSSNPSEYMTTTYKIARYAKPKELALWLGLDIHHANLSSRFRPCQQKVHPTKNIPFQQIQHSNLPVENEYEECGKNILCQSCDATSVILGKAWHKLCAQHILEGLVRSLILQLTGQRPFQPFSTQQPKHRCGPHCNLVDTAENFRIRTKALKRKRTSDQSSCSSKPNLE